MSNYFVNGNPWAGSFILEASIDGNSWEPMIAKSSTGKFLGKEGLVGAGNLSSGYNSVAFSDTTFSIYKLNDNYIAPNRTTSLNYTGTLKQNDIKLSCKVTLSHSTGSWTANSNSKEDFSVHCVLSSTQPPYWSATTQFNCVVIDYNTSTGELTFNATPTTFGSSIFAIIIRSGSGSGIIKEILPTSTFEVEKNEFLQVQTFANLSGSQTDFSAAFKTAFLPANNTCDMKRYVWQDRGVTIPTWSGLYPQSVGAGFTYTNIFSSLSDFAVGTNAPLGNIAGGHYSVIRYMWRFSSQTLVTSLMFYDATPGWQSEHVHFEVVASNDGTNFVRLPTEWHVAGQDTVEDTFHLKYDRYSKGGKRTFLFADNLKPAMDETSSSNISSGKWLVKYGSIRPIIYTVNFINTVAYEYYGFGNVGSNTPYSGSSRADTTTRTYARVPYGEANSKNHTINQTWLANYPPFQAVMSRLMVQDMPWLTNQTYGTYMFPNVSTVTPSSGPTVYKHWRIRATSAFLGACGTATKAYFWKLGLYRNTTLAAADTYGLSSNNYLQQYANVLGISTNGTTPTTQTGTKRDAMFVSKGDWTQEWGSSTLFASVDGSTALRNNAVDVTFNDELACIQFTLDVAGEIGAIRFPDNMYYDANVRGGTFIIEASNTPLVSTSWVAMVATSTTSSGKLGREGILNAVPSAGVIAAGNQALNANFKIFTIVPAAGSYTWPTLGTLTIPGGNLLNMMRRTGITVIITGGTSTNTTLDFNVHGIIASGVAPTLGSSTTFNCIVTNYALVSSDYTLTFECTPAFSGSCKFVVYVRSGEGTGVLGTTGVLISSSVTIDIPPISGNPVIDVVIGDWVKADTIPNTGSIRGVASFLQATGYPNPGNLNDYQTESIFGKKAIHFYANRAAGQGGALSNGYNNSGISLPRANVQTVSFWFHIPYRTIAAYPTNNSTWWLDAGDDGAGYRRTNNPLGGENNYDYHTIAPPNGSFANLSYYYMNGGAASSAFGSLMQLTLDTTTSWQHITFVFNKSVDTPRLRLFSDCRPMSGVDCYIGRFTVWDFAITRTQNDQNYGAGF